jgi:putative MFS transporter
MSHATPDFDTTDSLAAQRVDSAGVTGGLDPGHALDRIGVTRATRMILALVLLGGFFDVFEQNAVAVVGPSLQSTWGISAAQVGLLSTATFAAMVLGGLAGGALGDLFGRKTVFAFNLAIYSLGGLICAFAPNLEVLLVGRVVVGLGLGGELSIALTLLSEFASTKFRASAVSLFNVGAAGLGNPLAYGFGVLVLGVFGATLGGESGSWRWFFGLLALPALLVLWVRRFLPETPRYLVSKGRIDEANRSLSVVASGRLNPKGLTVTNYLSQHATASLQTERVRLIEVFQGKLLRNTLTVGFGAWMSFGAQLSILTLMPIVLVSRGYDITGSLTFTMVMNLGGLLGTLTACLLNYRARRRMVVIPGAVLACVFAFVFGFAANGTAQILIFGATFLFFVYMLNTTIWAWAPELYPTRVRAFGASVIVNLGLLAGAVMAPIAGALFESSGLVGLFSLVAVMYLLLAVLALLAPETHGKTLEAIHGEI